MIEKVNNKYNQNNREYSIGISSLKDGITFELIGNKLNTIANIYNNEEKILYDQSIKDGCDDTWIVKPSMSTERISHSGCGDVNLALVAGGKGASSEPEINSTELFDGSVWVYKENMNIGREYFSMVGYTNSALAIAGNFIRKTNSTEKYNGTVWTNSVNLNTTRRYGHIACGVINNAIVVGGNDGIVTIPNELDIKTDSTELFNGSVWSNSVRMNIGRIYHSGCGSSNSVLVTGGDSYNEYNMSSVEYFNGNTWVNKSNILYGRGYHCSCGVSDNAIIIGGGSTHYISDVEIYDGSVWIKSSSTGNYVSMNNNAVGDSNNALVTGGLSENTGAELYINNGFKYFKNKAVLKEFNKQLKNAISYIPKNAQPLLYNIRNHTSIGNSKIAINVGGIYMSTNFQCNSVTKFEENSWHHTGYAQLAIYSTSSCGNPNGFYIFGGITGNGSSATSVDTIISYDSMDQYINDAKLPFSINSLSSVGNYNSGLLTGGLKSDNTIIDNTLSFNGFVINSGINLPYSVCKHTLSGNINSSILTAGKITSTENTNKSINIINGIPIIGQDYISNTYNHSASGNYFSSLVIDKKNITEFDGNTWKLRYTMDNSRIQSAMSGSGIESSILTGGSISDLSTLLFKYTDNTFNIKDYIKITQNDIELEDINDSEQLWHNETTNNILSYGSTMIGKRYNALLFGGTEYSDSSLISNIEIYNGYLWEIYNNLLIPRYYHSTSGTPNCNITAGGIASGNMTYTLSSEIYINNTMKIGPDIISNKYNSYAQGIFNNAFLLGKGYGFMFDGNVWMTHNIFGKSNSEANSCNCGKMSSLINTYEKTCEINRSEASSVGANPITDKDNSRMVGNSTCAIITGGKNSKLSTEKYIGSDDTWTRLKNMNVEREGHACAGTTDEIIILGGNEQNKTIEIFTKCFIDSSIKLNLLSNSDIILDDQYDEYLDDINIDNNKIKIVKLNTDNLNIRINNHNGVWCVADNYMTSSNVYASSVGSKHSLIIVGGKVAESSLTNDTKKYQGYTTLTLQNAPVEICGSAIFGNSGSMGIVDGETKTQTIINNLYLFNDNEWKISADTDIDNCKFSKACGTVNNSIIVGGTNISLTNTTRFYKNIGGFTQGAELLVRMYKHSICGTPNNCIMIGNNINIFNFNGLVWKILNIPNQNLYYDAHISGNYNDFLFFGGLDDNNECMSYSEHFNGEYFSVTCKMNIPRYAHCGTTNSLSSSAIAIGGFGKKNHSTIIMQKSEEYIDNCNTILSKIEPKYNFIKNKIIYDISLDVDNDMCDIDINNDYIWKAFESRNTTISKNTHKFGSTIGNIKDCLYVDVDIVSHFNSYIWSTVENRSNINYHGMGSLGDLYNNCGIAGGAKKNKIYLNTEIFNGNTWSNKSYMNTGRVNFAVLSGALNSSVAIGGGTKIIDKNIDSSSCVNTVETFNGVTWSNNSFTMNTHRYIWCHGCGLYNAGIIIGGTNNDNTISALDISTIYNKGYILNISRSLYSSCSGRINNSIINCGTPSEDDLNYVNNISEMFNGDICKILNNSLQSRNLSDTGTTSGNISGSVMCEGSTISYGSCEYLYNERFYHNKSIFDIDNYDNKLNNIGISINYL